MHGISTYMNSDEGDPLTFMPDTCLHCGAPARFVYLLQLADKGVLKRMARPVCASHAMSENPARTVTRSEASWSHPAAGPVEAEPLMRAFLEAVDAELS